VLKFGSVDDEDHGYAYDAGWNLSYRTNNGSLEAFTVDGKNQLTNYSSAGENSFDANGNLTNYNYGATIFLHDDENRMISAEDVDKHKWATEFFYDGLWRLRARLEYNLTNSAWELAGQTRYVYDGWRVIQERDGDNTPRVSYTRGNDLSRSLEGAGGIAGLLARTDTDGSTFYHTDGNGNVTYLVDGSQALAASG